jgi:CTP:molybdopterin cytidylyltransferase MocA
VRRYDGRVTVAAVILFARPESAVGDAAGRPTARRIVESAWAGGATPIVVVAADPTGQLAMTLAGSPAVLAEPAPGEGGALAQLEHGIRVASAEVRGTDATLIWPGRMAWVDAETVTTLIEAHGADRQVLLRPAYAGTPGLPVLLPLDHLTALEPIGPGEPPDETLVDIRTTGLPLRTIDVGDPGVTHDIRQPYDELPAYSGPPEPVGGPPPEWGAAAAEMPDEAPLEGPAMAPYAQAAEEGD